MKLCYMSENDTEHQYGPMVRAAGYAGVTGAINSLNMWNADESELVAICQNPDGEGDIDGGVAKP